MTRIIVAFPKAENGKNIKNVLVRNGYQVVCVCTNGAQVIQEANGLQDGLVLCTYKLSDMPGFKPMSAIIILTGIFMGPECGFLVGSLSALTSNIFFGQGPWTPFQMLTWGIIGFLSGLPGLRKVLRNRIPLIIWGMLMGMLYSGIMDIWTVLDLTGVWSWKRYLMALSTAVPYIIAYMSSNVVFLMIGLKPLGEKLNRVQTKHGIF